MEDKVFGTGKNWTPTITQATAPKLTIKKSNYIKGAGDATGYDNQ